VSVSVIRERGTKGKDERKDEERGGEGGKDCDWNEYAISSCVAVLSNKAT
jgi:hypothetical protein